METFNEAFEDIDRIISSAPRKKNIQTIIGTDGNVHLAWPPPLDGATSSGPLASATTWDPRATLLDGFMASMDLVAINVSSKHTGPAWTLRHCAGASHNLHQNDYIFVPSHLAIKSEVLYDVILSDHRPVKAVLSFSMAGGSTEGKGFPRTCHHSPMGTAEPFRLNRVLKDVLPTLPTPLPKG